MLPCGWLPLDVDAFAMDNGGTAKEGVGRTDAGVDGYCPLAACLGCHGFCLELALRPGIQHAASETAFNLEPIVPMAQRLSAQGQKAPILARLNVPSRIQVWRHNRSNRPRPASALLTAQAIV